MRAIGRGSATVVLLLAVAPLSTALCDRVTLKDGTELECRVIGYDGGLFYIASPDMMTNVPAASVEKVRFSAGFEASRRPEQEQKREEAAAQPKKKLELNELEWVKAALAQPKAETMEPREILLKRMDIAGRMVRIDVPCHGDVEQCTPEIYGARLGEWQNSVKAAFSKDALEYINKMPYHKSHGKNREFTFYAVVMSEKMRRDLMGDKWSDFDVLLLGRIVKKDVAGKATYSW